MKSVALVSPVLGALAEIGSREEMDRVSGTGWAVGTAGGIAFLRVILPLVVLVKGSFVVRLSMVITALFFAVSAVPMFLGCSSSSCSSC